MTELSTSDLIALVGVFVGATAVLVSLAVAVGGMVFTMLAGLVGWAIKSQLKAITGRLDRHEGDIDKICSTLNDLGKQIVKCVERIRTLFSDHGRKGDSDDFA